ncbi:hypothetical protein ACHAXS_008016, partial [Conticribra weissflogii]
DSSGSGLVRGLPFFVLVDRLEAGPLTHEVEVQSPLLLQPSASTLTCSWPREHSPFSSSQSQYLTHLHQMTWFWLLE